MVIWTSSIDLTEEWCILRGATTGNQVYRLVRGHKNFPMILYQLTYIMHFKIPLYILYKSIHHSSIGTSFATICHCIAIRLTGVWRAGVLCRERQPFPLLQDEWFEDRFIRYPVWDADREDLQHKPNEPFIYIRVCVSWQCSLKSFELNTWYTNTGVGLFGSGIRYKDGRGAWSSNVV